MGFLPTGTITAGQIFSNASGGVTSAGNLTSLVGCNYYDANYTQRTVAAPSIGAPMQLSTFRGMAFTNGLNNPTGYSGTLADRPLQGGGVTDGIGTPYGSIYARLRTISYTSFLNYITSFTCKFDQYWDGNVSGVGGNAYLTITGNTRGSSVKQSIALATPGGTYNYTGTNVTGSFNYATGELKITSIYGGVPYTVSSNVGQNFIVSTIYAQAHAYGAANIAFGGTYRLARSYATYAAGGADPAVMTVLLGAAFTGGND